MLLFENKQRLAEIGVTAGQLEQLLSEVNYRLRPLEGQADTLAEYGHVVLEPIESIFW